jgi:hypothetical protein
MRITPQDTLKFSKSIKVVELEVLERTIKLITQRIEKVTEEIFHIFGIRLPKSFKKVEIEKFTYQKCVQRELFY